MCTPYISKRLQELATRAQNGERGESRGWSACKHCPQTCSPPSCQDQYGKGPKGAWVLTHLQAFSFEALTSTLKLARGVRGSSSANTTLFADVPARLALVDRGSALPPAPSPGCSFVFKYPPISRYCPSNWNRKRRETTTTMCGEPGPVTIPAGRRSRGAESGFPSQPTSLAGHLIFHTPGQPASPFATHVRFTPQTTPAMAPAGWGKVAGHHDTVGTICSFALPHTSVWPVTSIMPPPPLLPTC